MSWLALLVAPLGTPIGLVLLVRLARDPLVMGDQAISPFLARAGWTIALVTGGLGVLFVIAPAFGIL